MSEPWVTGIPGATKEVKPPPDPASQWIMSPPTTLATLAGSQNRVPGL